MRENHQIGRNRDAITGCRKKPHCGRRCRVRIGRLAYTTSTKTGVQGNIQPYTFISIIRISSVRLRWLSWGRCLQLPGLRVAFRAMKIDETPLLYRFVALCEALQGVSQVLDPRNESCCMREMADGGRCSRARNSLAAIEPEGHLETILLRLRLRRARTEHANRAW